MSTLANPVVAITVLIVMSIIILVGAAVLGVDRGVLASMGRRAFARGLITYLFAVVTIGTAAVVGLFALLPASDLALQEKQFNQAKEVLSLLLGVFGTIVGYYFGAEASRSDEARPLSASATRAVFHPESRRLEFRTRVSGGALPLHYSLSIDGRVVVDHKPVPTSGDILFEEILTASNDAYKILSLELIDNGNAALTQQLVCELKPRRRTSRQPAPANS